MFDSCRGPLTRQVGEPRAPKNKLIDTLLAGGGGEAAGFEGIEVTLECCLDLPQQSPAPMPNSTPTALAAID